MEQLRIIGGQRLSGEIRIKAAKNSVLPIMACCLLTKEDIIIQNVPDILDIKSMITIMKSLGAKCLYKNGNLYLNCKDATPNAIDSKLSSALRSSIFILGPVLSRFRYAKLGLPGGCAIGARPIDIHIDGLKALGVKVKESDSYIECDATSLRGGNINLKFPSVGATENLMMAAVFASGTTVINNAACEPEIIDLANFINLLGGKISGMGTKTLTMRGITRLGGAIYTPFGDRIVAPTFLAAGAATGGEVTVKGVNPHIAYSTLSVFFKAGCSVAAGRDYITVRANGKLKGVGNLVTGPHPNFATDLQSPVAEMLATSIGTTKIKETIFESRFNYVKQLNKMCANITTSKNTATIKGVKRLLGTTVLAEDLRGGAALVIAALSAEGASTINGTHHIDRGYENIEKDLKSLGANIKRIGLSK